jgi:hypothetical protein
MVDSKTPPEFPTVDEKEHAVTTSDLRENPVAIAIEIAEEVVSNKYSPWTWSMLRLYGVLFVAYCCGCLNGYDGSLMGGLNGMTSYQKTFDM